MKSLLRSIFSIDTRSLAAFRVGLGILVLWDLGVRMGAATAHYSDEGVLPVAAAKELFPETTWWSFHLLSGDVRWFYALSALLAFSAVLMIVGLHTRAAVFVVWLLSISMQSRNEMVLYGGDHYRRALLFWAVFLPLGEIWSIDARRTRSEPRMGFCSIWTVGAIAQVICVYVFAGLLKTGPEWRTEGSALYYALHIDDLVRPWSAFLLDYPNMLRLLSLCVVPIEICGPLLLLLPASFARGRVTGIVLLAAIHVGTIVFLYLFQIPWAGLCSLLLFLPPRVWNKLRPSASIATVPTDEGAREHWNVISCVLGSFFIVMLFNWNLSVLSPSSFAIPSFVKRVGMLLRFDQDWSFYAPFPYKTDGWFLIDGVLPDGAHVDVWNGTSGTPNEAKPFDLRTHFRNEHWDPYLYFTWTQTYGDQSSLFASYLCRNWQKEHAAALDRIRIRFQAETTQPNGQAAALQMIDLFDGACPRTETSVPLFQPVTEPLLTFAGCNGATREIQIGFSAYVTLDRALMEREKDDREQLTEAIQRQIRFAVGRFMAIHEGPLLIRPSSKDPQIQIRTIENVTYPFDIALTPVVHPDVTIESSYISAGLVRKSTHADDPAVRATYDASITAIACAADPNVVPSITVDVPVDPYLYYWMVGPDNFRPVSWRNSKFRINPCADAELADIPHPDYVWYFWNPTQTGVDDDGSDFDCHKLLSPGTHYLQSPAILSGLRQVGTVPIFSRNGLVSSEPLKIDIVFGIIDAKATNALALSASQLEASFATDTFPELERYIHNADTAVDRGSTYFLSFLHELRQVMNIASIDVQPSGHHVVISLTGTLPESDRAVAMRIYFGPTDLLSGDPPEHWQLVRDALQTSDVLLYNGHSGLGANMSYENIMQNTRADERPSLGESGFRVPRYQLLGYLSCYSWTYFGYDTVRERTRVRPDAVTDIVFTGSNFTSERGPLAILSHLDRLLHQPSEPVPLDGYLRAEDFFVVETFGRH